ncbi:hypothetical protein GCM10007857_16920 [Bradyrhizobium iriomotense]|uniref:Transposase n=1 Tax=Bradyrhizobium iriomotense TaxID=441950 RepID=A0ABQ6ARZ1_9BRAD|nr:hypothetical protein GCM10007857_16920 [Bradyrhizobium iriomotense]
MSAALTGEIEDRLDRECEHRPLDQVVAVFAKHRLRFGMLGKQPLIDERRQIVATRRRKLEASLDWIG